MQGPDPEGSNAADLILALSAAREAGDLAMSLWSKGTRNWRKSDGSPVSEADLAVDKLLHDALLSKRADTGWLSEESTDDARRLSCDHVWIADPIDGTRAFIDGRRDWCIAVALLSHGRPAVAVVYCPPRSEMFTASAGTGAFRNGEELRIVNGAKLGTAVIVANKSALARLGKHDGMPSHLPLSLRLCRVAENRSDAVLAITPKHDWDLAAGDLIVHEAGGMVSGLDGLTYRFNRPTPQQHGLIAAAPELHKEIVEALRTE